MGLAKLVLILCFSYGKKHHRAGFLTGQNKVCRIRKSTEITNNTLLHSTAVKDKTAGT